MFSPLVEAYDMILVDNSIKNPPFFTSEYVYSSQIYGSTFFNKNSALQN